MSGATTVLLVEDNPITCRLVCAALEGQGHRVVVAARGGAALEAFPRHRFGLVLQTLHLPDMDGFELVARLRALSGGGDVPILAFSGMLAPADEARVSSAGFDDVISKPVEPARLLQAVSAYVPQPELAPLEALGRGRRILVVDDDAVQRKLVAFRMQKAGFEVALASDGVEALEQARRTRPHVVLSDVLMPRVDGFALCVELRRDPAFAQVPVVLVTNSYVDPVDRDLARKAGAHDLVLRTPELREVLEAVRASLASTPPAGEALASHDEFAGEHQQRMMRQLERQVALNARVSQRCALLSAEVSVLRGISEALAGHEDIDEALKHALAACFDAGGISLGALYLKDGAGLRALSFGYTQGWSEPDLASFFGARGLLDAAIAAPQPTLVRAASAGAEGRLLLAAARVDAAALLPVAYKGVAFGALVMLGRADELEADDRLKFAEAVAGQISQALAVAHAFREKEQLQRASAEQASILRSVLESIGDGVAVVDRDGRLILSNSAAGALVKPGGAELDEVLPARLYEPDMVTPVPFHRSPLAQAGRGEAVDGVELFRRVEGPAGGVWLNANGRPWRDDQGVARGGVVVFRDVTREKATQSQLMVSDRMASVGMLAAGVAHEINNPLACVLANLELLQLDLADRAAAGELSELQEMLEDARASADRVRQIVRDLKIFSRREDSRLGPVDLTKVLESSVRMAWNEIRHRAQLVKRLAPGAFAEGTESRIGQVFLNLIVNAAQAIPEGNAAGNTITIVTRADAGGRLVTEISDTGAGIPAEKLPSLFTPFFTTKPQGVGTGLGLAICHRIVADLGGQIEVQSVPGAGTTFRVLLPAARGTAEPPAPPAPSLRAPRRARILVVDDEPMIGAVIGRILSDQHEVRSVTVATAALDLIRAGEAFDVILCDLMMPQMTGMELYAELQRLGSSQAACIVFLTGGAFTEAARAFFDQVPNQRLEKPFDTQHLRALVNARLA